MKRYWLGEALGIREPDTPFPWQEELLARFQRGVIERHLDIPTGLGKTAVMAIWLVARATGAALPGRLVYVVDRRAVVDQATDVALRLREFVDRNAEIKAALGLSGSLPISALRGQHVDNREWLDDPASPAIIVGTVDMIGSRLLFEGYRTSRKMRPYHAGLLGADTLLVLDEAHLVPPFQKLLEAIAEGARSSFGPREENLHKLVSGFRLLSLSATGRAQEHKPFSLTEADLTPGSVARKRLDAPKLLTILPVQEGENLPDLLAQEAWKLTDKGDAPLRVIVFCDKRDVAAAAKEAVEKLAKGDKKHDIVEVKVDTQLFVGGRRVLEREAAATWLKNHGFLAGTKTERQRPAFVFATSAGEVGVDLDADHMVCDLVAWERMVQRLGRVNRRGDGDARVVVLFQEPKLSKAVKDAQEKLPEQRSEKETKAVVDHETKVKAARVLAKPFDLLSHHDGFTDASPGALRELRLSAEPAPLDFTEADAHVRTWRRWILDSATSPVPLHPALSRAPVDAWSLTSLEEHTGRPEIEPWLRGWVDEELQTAVVWRKHLPVRVGDDRGTKRQVKEIKAFFEAAPPHTSEVLETTTSRVLNWLINRVEAQQGAISRTSGLSSTGAVHNEPRLSQSDVAAIILSAAGDVRRVLRLSDLFFEGADKKADDRRKGELHRVIAGATLVVNARVAGLSDDGLLNDNTQTLPRTIDDGRDWLPPIDGDPAVRFRVRVLQEGQAAVSEKGWRQRYRLATEQSVEGEPERWIIVEKWRSDSTTEDDRSAGRLQRLEDHQNCAEAKARKIATTLALPEEYVEMLAITARVHDEGKRATRWQRAFNAPLDCDYAKTPGPIDFGLLDGYRHELASLGVAKRNADFKKLSDDLQDLALHLLAAHHGFARPIIGVNGCEDAPPSMLQERAREVALRFARLQIAESSVLSAINNRMITEKDFVRAGRAVNLSAAGRKQFFVAYEARMNHLVTHPIFDYKVTYRRALELQFRILARYLIGEIDEYVPFMTR